MRDNDIELMFANSLMRIMETGIELLLHYEENSFPEEKFSIIKELSSITSELLKHKSTCDKMKEVAKSSEFNGKNVDEKFETFIMIRNVINHFPIFESWDDVFITKEMIEWNNPKYSQIKDFFKEEKKYSYKIFLMDNGIWTPKKDIEINIPKLIDGDRIYLSDFLSLDDALWTFTIIDYYLQFLGLNVEPRYLISA